MRIIKSLQGAALAVANTWTALQTFNTASGKIIDLQSASVEQAYFDANGVLVFVGTGSAAGTLDYIQQNSDSIYINAAAAAGRVALRVNQQESFWITQTKVTKIFNIATAGLGIPAIYASSIQSQSNAAPTTVSYTPPSTAGTYRITANLEITTATTITFKNKLTYTSASGAATTDRPVWERQNSATILAEPTANTADRFVMEPYQFTIDNSAGAIALADDAGTYTTCAYRLGVILEQLA